MALKNDVTCRHFAIASQIAHQTIGDSAFTAAAFAHQAQGLAALDAERDIAHRAHLPMPCAIGNGEIGDVDDGLLGGVCHGYLRFNHESRVTSQRINGQAPPKGDP